MDGKEINSGEASRLGAASSGPCPNCGSGDMARGIKFNQGIEVGPFGPVYKAAGIFRGTETLYADLCRTCGSVTRFFVKRTDRNWDQS